MNCVWIATVEYLRCQNCNGPNVANIYSAPNLWPKRNCKNVEPPKPPRETVLDYLRAHPGATIGEIVSSCSGCKDKLADALRELVKSGEVLKTGENPPLYSAISK